MPQALNSVDLAHMKGWTNAYMKSAVFSSHDYAMVDAFFEIIADA